MREVVSTGTAVNKDVEEFDLVVLGTGEGAKFLAWTESRKGKRVASVERRWIGGSCPNIACLPSKNIVHSAKVASYFKRSEEFGITKSDVRIDMAKVTQRKRDMVAALVEIHVNNFKTSGVDLLLGEGRFIAPRTLEVTLADGGTRILRGGKVVIGTGTRATLPDLPGMAEAKPMTHIEALELEHLPEHLLVLGGGFIGLEFAQAMRRLGSRVTVIDRNTRLAPKEDEDVSAGLLELLTDEGVEFVFNAEARSVSGVSGEAIELQLLAGGKELLVKGTDLLVSAGRTPNTEGIGLDLAGVAVNARGLIEVDAKLRTSAENVWAIGECAGSPQFTHIAFDDFRVIQGDFAGGERVTTGRQVPFCLFTDPEFARVGLSETEARAKGIPYRMAKIPMKAVLRTRTLSETRGFLKALIAADSDEILGFTAFGVDGGEIMSAVQIAMIAKLPYTGLRDAILTHPTLMEGLVILFTAVPPRASSH